MASWPTKISLAALCAMLVLPFLNPLHLHPIPTFYQEWLAAACGVFAAMLLLRERRLEHLELPGMALLPLGLIAILLLQLVAGLVFFPAQALIFALYLLWSLLLLTLGRSLRQEVDLDELATLFATAILAGTLLSALLVALQLGNARAPEAWVFRDARGSANLAQVNHLANYLWLGIASAIYLHAQGKIGKALFAACALLLIGAASFTGSRSILIYAVLLALLSGWAAWHYRQTVLHKIAKASFAVLAATVLLQFISVHLDLAQALQIPLSGDRLVREVSGTSQRIQLWRTGLAIFAEHPWLGAGIGQFPVRAYQIVGAQPDRGYLGGGEHAHNLLIDLLAEQGLLAAVLVVLFGLRWWFAFIRQEWSAAHWWIAAVLLVLAAHSQLEYPLWYAFFLGIAAILLGVGSGSGLHPRITASGKALIALILLFGALTLFTMRADYRLLEDTLNRRPNSNNVKPSWDEMRTAFNTLQRQSLFGHYVSLYYAYQLSVDKDLLKHKIAVVAAAIQLSPVDKVTFKLAYLLALDERPEEARVALRRAIATYPHFVPDARRQVGLLLPSFPELAPLADDLRLARGAP